MLTEPQNEKDLRPRGGGQRAGLAVRPFKAENKLPRLFSGKISTFLKENYYRPRK